MIITSIIFCLSSIVLSQEEYKLSVSTVTYSHGYVSVCLPLSNMLQWEQSSLGYTGGDGWGCRVYTYPNFLDYFIRERYLKIPGENLNMFSLISKFWTGSGEAMHPKIYIPEEYMQGRLPLWIVAEIIRDLWLSKQ